MRSPTLLVLFLLLSTVYSEIAFYVDEPSPLDTPSREHHHQRHRHRHGRDHSTPPYRAAASTTISSDGSQERFSLNCPHVVDASNKDVKIEVTWTLDDTVWLKVRDGEELVGKQQTQFNRKRIGSKSVLRVELNKGRYMFNYDELTGDFAMEINPVIPEEDFGTWECHVTMQQKQTTNTLTSRSRIKGPPGAVRTPDGEFSTTAKEQRMTTLGYRIPPHDDAHHKVYPPARIVYGDNDEDDDEGDRNGNKEKKFSAFTRPDKNSLQISRDANKRKATVTFNRSVTKSHQPSPHLAQIDYELDMAEDENDDFRYEHRSRVRAAAQGANGVSTVTAGASLVSLTVTFAIAILF